MAGRRAQSHVETPKTHSAGYGGYGRDSLAVARKSGAEKAHKNKSPKIFEIPMDGWVSLGHPAGVPAKRPFSVSFSIVDNRNSLAKKTCLSRRVSQEHQAGVPKIFFELMCVLLS